MKENIKWIVLFYIAAAVTAAFIGWMAYSLFAPTTYIVK